MDLRSPSRNSSLWGKAWSKTLWRELRSQLPSLKLWDLTPQPATIHQLLNSMRINQVEAFKDAHVQVLPLVNRPLESQIHGTVNFTCFCFFFARNVVPSCALVVLSLPKVRSNKCLLLRGLN